MAKLYFRFSAMNAGKTAMAIQDAYNYAELGMKCIVLKPSVDNRFDMDDRIVSRSGVSFPCITIDEDYDILSLMGSMKIHCIVVDEAQFLSIDQVDQLTDIVDMYDIPILAYGLKTAFDGKLFPASKRLLEVADKIEEPRKTLCWCGNKATMNARVVDGIVIKTGETVKVGGNELYTPLCRKHYKLNQLGEGEQ